MLNRQQSTTFGLLCASAIVVLDFFIVLACVPGFKSSLGASEAQTQLVLAAYAIANASVLVFGGRLGDLHGRVRVLRFGLVAFAVSSAGCALAASPWALIAARVVQGLAGAFIQPQVLALLSGSVAAEARARVFGLYAAAMGLSGIVAQLLGGVLVELLPVDLGWRACFFAAVPLCAASVVLTLRMVDEQSAKRGDEALDLIGSGLLVGAVGCICTFLTMGREQGWPAWSWVALAVGGLSALAFVQWQRVGWQGAAPRIVPKGVVGFAGFGSALICVLSFFSGVASLYFLLALALRMHAGFSPLQTGLLFGWLGGCFVWASMSKSLRGVLGKRWVSAGSLLLVAGHVAFGLAFASTERWLKIGVLFACALEGLGLGVIMGPLMALALSAVAKENASVGGGLATATQQVGNSLGVALIGLAYFGNGRGDVGSITGAVGYLTVTVVVFAVVMWSRSSGTAQRQPS